MGSGSHKSNRMGFPNRNGRSTLWNYSGVASICVSGLFATCPKPQRPAMTCKSAKAKRRKAYPADGSVNGLIPLRRPDFGLNPLCFHADPHLPRRQDRHAVFRDGLSDRC